MNKEIASIKKRLKTQINHLYLYSGFFNQHDITPEQYDKYKKEIDKANIIIEALQKEFILVVGRWSKLMNAEAVKQQWDMVVKEIERGL